ncbi:MULTISPECIES: HNH endonuclease [Microbacterium]|uniref:HNH endonuclease n=1 Tax=Microbacterium TaxID=33882 RepID=UPI000A068297|nr:HNH endonuclease signature motif containing protein [Microbacterium profundi]
MSACGPIPGTCTTRTGPRRTVDRVGSDPAQYGERVPSGRRFPPAARSAAARARYAKRRKQRLARADNDLTPAQWASLRDAWGGCAYCQGSNAALQRDCIMPISRGGRYTLENVVPACASCNASKHNGEVTAWLRRKKLDERTFLVRHAKILNELLSADEHNDA